MPAVSKRQFAYMQGVAHGSIKSKSLSKKQAKEFISGQKPTGLPQRAKKKKK